MVAFDIGGLPDSVEYQKTGYPAKAFETEDLARGILWVLKRGWIATGLRPSRWRWSAISRRTATFSRTHEDVR